MVLDIRSNRGGASTIPGPFIKEVRKSEFNQAGKLYAIMGKETYSSAVLYDVNLRERLSPFRGGNHRCQPSHYREVRQFGLPGSAITIRCSTRFFHCLDRDDNILEADKVIEETFASRREGTGPVMACIMKQD